MISEQEAREASKRLDDDEVDTIPFRDSKTRLGDLLTLWFWCREEFSRRDAERAEREKPITAEWLESIGFENQTLYFAMHVNNVHVLWHFTTSRVRLGGLFIGVYKTRGQLLDLLAALKGGAT